MTAALLATLPLWPDCPLPGCKNPTDHPAQPCETCLALFGDMLQPTGTQRDADEVAAELAERDEYVRAAYAAQRAMTPLPEPQAPPEPVEWRRNQTCWCCDERRTCCLDPDQPKRWICKTCLAIPVTTEGLAGA